MPEILRLGFAGLGEAATRVLPEITQLPMIKIAAAADMRKNALETFRQEFEARGYESVQALCESPDVDAIYVATPHELHAEHTILAAKNGKHVIVEKPMALSIRDCEEMNDAAEKHRVKLLCGHTHSFDPAIRKMREILVSGQLGKPCMINSWNYNDFMVRPYTNRDLDSSHGVVLNQGPHQVDIVRLLGGGKVKSVRARTGKWDPLRAEGAYICYLEFEDGTPATLVYNGYGFFDTAELFWWIGEGGYQRHPNTNTHARKNYKAVQGPNFEAKLETFKEQLRYGARKTDEGGAPSHGWPGLDDESQERKHQKFFGLTLVSCEYGDMRQSADGIYVYGDEKIEIPIGKALVGRQAEVLELYEAVMHGRPVFHDGRWGEATLEVCLAILQSTAERREIQMLHQVAAWE
jgi:phthalate 4,5-cis-dihydrodiol dehydrogenase